MASPVRLLLACPELSPSDILPFWDNSYACKFTGKVRYDGHEDIVHHNVVWADDPAEAENLVCETHGCKPIKIYQISGYWREWLNNQFTQLYHLDHGQYVRANPNPRLLHNRWKYLTTPA